MKEPNHSLEHKRAEYAANSLSKSEVASSPFVQFESWFKIALESEQREPYAMSIASADLSGQPTMRMVLLRHFSHEGFIFYTNYNSKKGQNLAANPKAALLFFWEGQERQIRIEGVVEKVSEQTSIDYFAKRPFKSQAAAVASDQSEVVASRKVLEDKFAEVLAANSEEEGITKPGHWGGYILKPTHFEFWQGRKSRLHDRIVYDWNEGEWRIERLAP